MEKIPEIATAATIVTILKEQISGFSQKENYIALWQKTIVIIPTITEPEELDFFWTSFIKNRPLRNWLYLKEPYEDYDYLHFIKKAIFLRFIAIADSIDKLFSVDIVKAHLFNDEEVTVALYEKQKELSSKEQ